MVVLLLCRGSCGGVEVGAVALGQLAARLDDYTEEVRRGAAWALDQLGWKPGELSERVLFLMARRRIPEVVELGEFALPSLVALLGVSHQHDYELLTETFVQIGEPATNALVAELLREAALPYVRTRAADILVAIGWVPENARQRMWWLAALQKWEECLGMDACGREFILTILRGRFYNWWGGFNQAVEKRIGEDASWFILNTLQRENPRIEAFVADLLVQVRDGRADEFLRGVLADSHSVIRCFAAYTLAERLDARAIDVLVTALDDNECWPHWFIMKRLGEVARKNGRALGALLHALHDSNWRTRASAASILGEVGGDRAAEALLEALSDPDFGDHGAVAESLAALRESRAVPTLMGIMDRPYDRWYAAKALKLITGQEPGRDPSNRTSGKDE